jgi:predicted ferric reductase
MNPQLWWYVARAGGLVAYGLLAASVLWGLAVSTRLLGRWPAPGWTLDLHRYLGGLALTFTGIHLAALLLDSYIQFHLLDLLIPFASTWRPGAVAWGVVALYLLIAVQATSLARRRLPHRLWRRIHLAAFPLLVASTGHLLTAGSDRANPAVRTMLTATVATTTFLLLFRLLHRPGPNRSRQPKRRAAPSHPARGRGGTNPRPETGGYEDDPTSKAAMAPKYSA